MSADAWGVQAIVLFPWNLEITTFLEFYSLNIPLFAGVLIREDVRPVSRRRLQGVLVREGMSSKTA